MGSFDMVVELEVGEGLDEKLKGGEDGVMVFGG